MLKIYKNMPKVQTYKELLNLAFNQARKTAESTHIRGDKRLAFMIRDLRRIEKSRDIITKHFKMILEKTPRFDELPEFYKKLISTIVDVPQFKKSLAATKWASDMTLALAEQYKKRLKGAQMRDLSRIRNQYYGRESSVLKQIRNDLIFLEDCRIALKNLPKFKEMKTFILAGPPNVGKSSLLRALTTAEPKVQPYPFTTKTIKVGYIDELVQLIDTPGLLDRDMKKKNNIEKRSTAALKHLSKDILFIFDPTETCGYPIKEQINIFKSIERELNLKMTIIINKTDMDYSEEDSKRIESLSKNIFYISALKKEGIDKLRTFLVKGTFLGKEKFYKKKTGSVKEDSINKNQKKTFQEYQNNPTEQEQKKTDK